MGNGPTKKKNEKKNPFFCRHPSAHPFQFMISLFNSVASIDRRSWNRTFHDVFFLRCSVFFPVITNKKKRRKRNALNRWTSENADWLDTSCVCVCVCVLVCVLVCFFSFRCSLFIRSFWVFVYFIRFFLNFFHCFPFLSSLGFVQYRSRTR